jgi:hypothetical protein
MVRTGLIVAALLAAGGLGLAQEKPADEREKEQQKSRAEHRAKFFKECGTELPELEKRFLAGVGSLPVVAVEKSDRPAVRAAKRAVNAEAERYKLIQSRIERGSFSGSSQYLQLSACVFDQYAAAALVWDDPEKLLPFAEAVVLALLDAEEFNLPRVAMGVEEPQLRPQLTAARWRAEVVALKLWEKVKKPEPAKGADTPAVRAGKKALQAEAERYELIRTRINAGSFAGASQYSQFTDCILRQYSAAALVWDDPEKLLPYAEAAVKQLTQALDFNAPRVEKAVEEPQLLPQLKAALHRAEAEVLMLKEKAKKK